MSDFIEEIIQEEEIERFFINEHLNVNERILFILKKGYPIQKEVLIRNIPIYLEKKESLEYMINLIIEYIEIWSENLQVEFARAISKLFECEGAKSCKEILYSNSTNFINPLIKILIKIIVTDDKTVSEECIQAVNSIRIFFSSYKKIKIDQDIIENINQMGSFGRSAPFKRFCVFFCSELIQMMSNPITELFNRLMILSSDTEKIIRQELAYHTKFLYKHLDEASVRKSVYKVIESYITEDDILLKTEGIHTFLTMYNKFPDDHLLEMVNEEVKILFEETHKKSIMNNIQFYIKIFKQLVCCLGEQSDRNLIFKYGENVCLFLNNFVISTQNSGELVEGGNSTIQGVFSSNSGNIGVPVNGLVHDNSDTLHFISTPSENLEGGSLPLTNKIDFLIEDMHYLIKILKVKKNEQLLYDMLNLVFENLITSCTSNNLNNSTNITSTLTTNRNNNQDSYSSSSFYIPKLNLSTIFFNNLSGILEALEIDEQNTYILNKLFNLFNEVHSQNQVTNSKDTTQGSNSVTNPQNLINSNQVYPITTTPPVKPLISILLDNLDKILLIAEKQQNIQFFLLFYSYLSKIDKFITEPPIQWRSIVSFISNIRKVEFIYRISEESSESVLYQMKTYLSKENYQIQSEVMKLMSSIIKHCKATLRKEVIKYLISEFANATTFYKRRLFLVFTDEIIQKFSVTFLKEEGILEAVIHLLTLSKTNYSFYTKIFEYLKYFIPYLESDKVLIEIINKRIEGIKNCVSTGEIIDSEIKKSLKKYEKWNESYQKNNNERLIQEDVKRYKRELDYFERDINYILKPNKTNDDLQTISGKKVKDTKSTGKGSKKTSHGNNLSDKNVGGRHRISSINAFNSSNKQQTSTSKNPNKKIITKLSDDNIISIKDNQYSKALQTDPDLILTNSNKKSSEKITICTNAPTIKSSFSSIIGSNSTANSRRTKLSNSLKEGSSSIKVDDINIDLNSRSITRINTIATTPVNKFSNNSNNSGSLISGKKNVFSKK